VGGRAGTDGEASRVADIGEMIEELEAVDEAERRRLAADRLEADRRAISADVFRRRIDDDRRAAIERPRGALSGCAP